MIFTLIGLCVATWLLMGGSKNVWEKIMLLFFLVAAYVGFRLLTGASIDEIIAPFLLENNTP